MMRQSFAPCFYLSFKNEYFVKTLAGNREMINFPLICTISTESVNLTDFISEGRKVMHQRFCRLSEDDPEPDDEEGSNGCDETVKC